MANSCVDPPRALRWYIPVVIVLKRISSRRWRPIGLGLVAAVLLAACRPAEIVEAPFEPSASHAEYRAGLVAMELTDTAIGSRWTAEADRALAEAFAITLPYREIAQFDPTRPRALGLRFAAIRGQRIEITLELEAGAAGRTFADVYRITDGGFESYPQVASYSNERNELAFEPRRDGEYILRLQPELLRGGRFVVTIRTTPALSFPVEGHDVGDIWSFFGDPRDGGARRHEGVDVFAPRGTPVLAVAHGVVRSVGTRDLGGLTVSIVDEERDLIYYYAHLDEQLTTRGAVVAPGDVVGTVGNTGNAITTPPHLHFGIYERRWNALDPWEFLFTYDSEPEPVTGDPALLGDRVWLVPAGAGGGDREATAIVEGLRANEYRVFIAERDSERYVPRRAVLPVGDSG